MIERLDIADDQQHLDIAAGTGEPGLSSRQARAEGPRRPDRPRARRCSTSRRDGRLRRGSPTSRRGCAAPTTCRSVTRRSTASRCGSGTCSSPTSARRPPSSCVCSSRADVSARRSGSSPRRTRGRRSPCRRSRRRRCWRRPTRIGPNMFRCAAPGYVSALYEAAGLRDVAEREVAVELVTRSPAEYWEMISEHVSLAVAALQQVDEPARERIAQAVIAEGRCVSRRTARSGFRAWPAASSARSSN